MDKVDLHTAEGRRAYRDELNGVARPYRWAGLAFILVGAFLLWGSTRGWLGLTDGAQVWGYGALAIGWVLFLTATFLRTRHHKRRLAQGL